MRTLPVGGTCANSNGRAGARCSKETQIACLCDTTQNLHFAAGIRLMHAGECTTMPVFFLCWANTNFWAQHSRMKNKICLRAQCSYRNNIVKYSRGPSTYFHPANEVPMCGLCLCVFPSIDPSQFLRFIWLLRYAISCTFVMVSAYDLIAHAPFLLKSSYLCIWSLTAHPLVRMVQARV